MYLRSIEYDESLIEPYTDSDVWVAANTAITKDAWNDAWRRYQNRFNTSIEDLLKKLRQYDDMSAYSLPPRGNVQYFVKPQRSGKRQFISLFDEWLHYHETVELDRLQDPEYMKLLKETTLEQISDRFDDRRDMGLWSRWSDDYKAESCYWDFKHPVYFTRRVERSDLGVVGGD